MGEAFGELLDNDERSEEALLIDTSYTNEIVSAMVLVLTSAYKPSNATMI